MRPRFGIVRGLLTASENHRDAARRVKLDDHVRTFIDSPDVVVLVDSHGVSFRPGI